MINWILDKYYSWRLSRIAQDSIDLEQFRQDVMSYLYNDGEDNYDNTRTGND